MPAQIPPAAWMAGESVLTMIRSSPGAIPSFSTPMTWTVNGLGVVPLLTVKPVPVRPAFTWLTGTAAGQGAGGAAAVWALAGAGSVWAAAGAASAPSASSGATVATATARRPRGRKWRREDMGGPSGPARDAGQRRRWAGGNGPGGRPGRLADHLVFACERPAFTGAPMARRRLDEHRDGTASGRATGI